MAVTVKTLQPSASGFKWASVGNPNLTIIEKPENFFVTSGHPPRCFTQSLIDLLVRRVPPYRIPPLATFLWSLNLVAVERPTI